MVGLPQNIPIPAESSIASYSWTDIISGAGYDNFYLSAIPSGFSLSSKAVATNTVSTGSQTGFTTSLFNTPRTLNGRIFLEFGGVSTYIGAGGRTSTVGGELKKVSGGVTTSLGTFTGYSKSQSSVTSQIMGCAYLDVTDVNIKIDDYLIFDLAITNEAGATVTVYIDPKATTSGQLEITKLLIPVKIDL
jgi:hypothetical protein